MWILRSTLYQTQGEWANLTDLQRIAAEHGLEISSEELASLAAQVEERQKLVLQLMSSYELTSFPRLFINKVAIPMTLEQDFKSYL